MTRDEQFAIIDKARGIILAWAHAEGIPLNRIEFVVPFVATDFGLSTWFFYESEAHRQQSERMGWSPKLKKAFARILSAEGYSTDWLPAVDFVFDSHENVVTNYHGSYFYRLR